MAAEAATVVGLISFGIQVSQGLISYYSAYKDRDSDIRNAYESLEDLANTFELLQSALARPQLEARKAEQVEECMRRCQGGLDALERELRSLEAHKDPKGFRQKARVQVQRVTYPFQAGTLARLCKIAGELKQNLILALQVLQVNIGANLQHAIDLVAADTKAIRDAQQSDQWKKILAWLAPSDPLSNHLAARNRHEKTTGTWLLDSTQYVEWKTGPFGHLWLHGMAGCGKTVLCSTISEDIQTHCSTRPNTAHAIFYFTFSDNRKQSYADLLRSLVAQLGHHEPGLSMLVQHYEQQHHPGPDRLEEIVSASISAYDEVFILLDALDECPESEDIREEVLECMERISESAWNLRILGTSRDVKDIRTSMETLPATAVLMHDASVNNDIRRYIATQLEEDRRLRQMNPDIKSLIETTISEKANGMFRWAYCQLQALKQLRSTKPKYVKETLSTLPATLDETYERILGGISPMFQREALTLLRWLVYAESPLTLRELAEAAIIDPNGEVEVDVEIRGDIEGTLSILSGLVSLEPNRAMHDPYTRSRLERGDDDDRSSDSDAWQDTQPMEQKIVKLSHFSVQEYLQSKRILESKSKEFHLEDAQAHHYLAQSCLAYLAYFSGTQDKGYKEVELREAPLLRYAARSWPRHFVLQGSEDLDRALFLLNSEEARRRWICVYDTFPTSAHKLYYNTRPVASAVYYASYHGLEPLVAELIKCGADVNAEGGEYGFPLQAASRKGHEKVVRMLIAAGADVNRTKPNLAYQTALSRAVGYGHERVVQTLLDAGADVTADTEYLILEAMHMGYTTVLRVLLNASGDSGFQFLMPRAVQFGRVDVVQLLLEAGADANMRHDENTPLHAAASVGDEPIVQMLLNAGADADARGKGGGRPLGIAAGKGHPKVAQLLLDAGADVNAGEGDVLRWAVRARNVPGVQLLLDAGADVNISKDGEESILYETCAQGYREMVRVLLDGGADVNAQSPLSGETAMQVALGKCHFVIRDMLLKAKKERKK